MTDYNDGEWHGWNGGECPVHPNSKVDVTFEEDGTHKGRCAYGWKWNDLETPIIAFRVTKPYIEPPAPKVIWVNEYADNGFNVHKSEESAVVSARPHATRVAVRYVEQPE